MTEIIVALLALLGTALGSFSGFRLTSYRVEQLEKNGVIRGYHADIDLRALPKGIRFMLDIEAAPGYYTEVIETLAASSMLHEIYGTSGKSRIHVIGVAPNSETLGKYASYLYRTTKGIRELAKAMLAEEKDA